MPLFKTKETREEERAEHEDEARRIGYLVVAAEGPAAIPETIERHIADGWVLDRVVYNALGPTVMTWRQVNVTLIFKWPAASA